MNVENISILSIFVAGFLSALTPPVLIIIPAYSAYLSGSNPLVKSTRTRNLIFLLYALMFWGGFALIFIVLFGMPIGITGGSLLTISQILPIIGGLFLILFAIYIVIRTFLQIFLKEKMVSFLTPPIDIILTIINCLRSIFLGAVFATSWTPAVGPILGNVLTVAIQGQNVSLAMFYLFVYSLGLAIPLLIAGLLLMYVTNYLRNLNEYLGVVEHFVSAILLFIYGLMLLTGIFTTLNVFLNRFIPSWLVGRM